MTVEEALRRCADELEAEIKSRYANMLDYPSIKRKYNLDMQTVIDARAALAAAEKGSADIRDHVWRARCELAALVPDPRKVSSTSWMEALRNGKYADADCLYRAWIFLDGALRLLSAPLSEG